MLRFVLLALVLLPLAPASASTCPPAASETSVAYASLGSDPHYGVRVLDTDIREEIFYWPGGRSADVWRETNGREGLQTAASDCGPADTRVAGASAGTGRPTLPL